MKRNGIVCEYGSTSEMFANWGEHYITGSPAAVQLEKKLEETLGMPSLLTTRGMTAIMASIFPFLPAKVVLSREVYPGTKILLQEWEKASLLSLSFFDPDNLDQLENLLGDPLSEANDFAIVFAESIGNSREMKVADVPAILALCKKYGAMLVVDTTFTPFVKFEADSALIVVGSMTKYEQPKDDWTGGRISSTSKNIQTIRDTRMFGNMAMSPDVAGFYLEAIRDARERYELHSRIAMELADACKVLRPIQDVFYPGLDNHAGYEIVRDGYGGVAGGVFYIVFKGGDKAAIAFCDFLAQKSEHWKIAVSFGSGDFRVFPVTERHSAFFDYVPGLVRISTGRNDPMGAFTDMLAALNSLDAPAGK